MRKTNLSKLIILPFLVLGLMAGSNVHAAVATAPTLGTAAAYSALGKAGVTNVIAVGTVLSGFVGADASITGFPPGVSGGQFLAPTVNTPEADAGIAYGQMDAQVGGVAQTLAGNVTISPGIYDVDGGGSTGGVITLDGAGVYLFQAKVANITIAGGTTILLTNGATACNVFWEAHTGMTIGVGAQMVGTIISDIASITFATSATLNGRAIALGAGQVTLDNNQISGPTCAAPPSGSQPLANYNVIKRVVNNSGSTGIPANFNIHVTSTENNSNTEVAGSPAPGQVDPGTLYTLPQGTYSVREDVNSAYSFSYSGDCDVNGDINLYWGNNKTCIITNTRIVAPVPPIIDVVKIPSPLALPAGPGSVTYSYTVRNIGIVPMYNVTAVDNLCSPLVMVSGDTNNDSKLDVTEIWRYTCSAFLTATRTNTVTATGQANGFTVTDIAQATVVVGSPLVPPLIHVVKVPDPLTLPPGGGTVTYRYTVTNPGTEPLNNVGLTDDKCTGLPTRVIGHPGDLNKNDILEPNERWSFTCNTVITSTTTNTVIATGSANGFTVTDSAFAIVVVAVPSLPNTGSDENGTLWNIILLVAGIASLAGAYAYRRKQMMKRKLDLM